MPKWKTFGPIERTSSGKQTLTTGRQAPVFKIPAPVLRYAAEYVAYLTRMHAACHSFLDARRNTETIVFDSDEQDLLATVWKCLGCIKPACETRPMVCFECPSVRGPPQRHHLYCVECVNGILARRHRKRRSSKSVLRTTACPKCRNSGYKGKPLYGEDDTQQFRVFEIRQILSCPETIV